MDPAMSRKDRTSLEQRIAEALRRYATEPYVVLDEALCKMLAAHIARHLRGET